MAKILVVVRFESDGARKAGRPATVAVVVAAVVATASTVESLDICLETVRSPRSQENQVVVAAAVAVIVSTVDSLATCPESALSPKNPESLVAVEAVAVTALIVVSLVTCLVNAPSQGSPERSRDLEVDLLETGRLSDLSSVAKIAF